MKSHQYTISVRDVGYALGSILIPAICLAVVLRIGAVSGLWPKPWPALDLEHTVLTHQATASQTSNPADLLFIGDSSCLMDISGAELATLYKGTSPPINLGSFMYVGFEGYATMLARYAKTNPGRLRKVVLLIHPEMLRGTEPVPEYLRFISTLYTGDDYGDKGSVLGQVRGFLGLDIFQNRMLSRLPQPLPKEYGRFYGFNLDLYNFMQANHGCAVDPHQYHPGPAQGNAEYRLASSLDARCRAFRAAVPSGAQLVLGLTPIPESFAPTSYGARWQQMLSQWGQLIGADGVLTNLPAALPDDCFASTTHLNQRGAVQYSRQLVAALSAL
jgi:hypothetical protein